MSVFSSTLRATLEMDLAPFAKNLTTADRRLVEFANSSQKSARESANVFEEVAKAEANLAAARVAQAEATNRSITASQQSLVKSARESAAVFQDIADREAELANARMAHAQEVNRSITAGQSVVGKSARESAAVFEAFFATQQKGWRGLWGRVTGGVGDLKRTLSSAGGGGLFARFLGVGAVLTAFGAALQRAQDLRAEAQRLGRPVSDSVTRVAKLADTFDRAKSSAADFGVTTLSALAKIGEWSGQNAARIGGLFAGRSFAETDRRISLSETAGANADRLNAETEDPKVKKNLEERDRQREETRRKELNDFNLLNQLYKDRDKLLVASLDKTKTLAERTAAQAALAKKDDEIFERRRKMQEQSDEEREKAERDAQDARERREKEETRKTKERIELLKKEVEDARKKYEEARAAKDAFFAADVIAAREAEDARLPTLAELRSGEKGSVEDRRRAREIEKKEAEAKRLQGRTDLSFNDRDSAGRSRQETGEERSRRLGQEAKAARNDLAEKERVKESERGTPRTDQFSRDIANQDARSTEAEYKAALVQVETYLQSIDEKLTSTPV